MKRWAEVAHDRAAMAMRRLEPAGAGRLAMPLPHITNEEYRGIIRGAGIVRRVDSAPIEDVPIASITSIQGSLNAERLAEYVGGKKVRPGQRKPSSGMLCDRPIIVRKGGVSYSHDGNHRIVAAMLDGEKTIRARVVDLDAAPSR